MPPFRAWYSSIGQAPLNLNFEVMTLFSWPYSGGTSFHHHDWYSKFDSKYLKNKTSTSHSNHNRNHKCMNCLGPCSERSPKMLVCKFITKNLIKSLMKSLSLCTLYIKSDCHLSLACIQLHRDCIYDRQDYSSWNHTTVFSSK